MKKIIFVDSTRRLAIKATIKCSEIIALSVTEIEKLQLPVPPIRFLFVETRKILMTKSHQITNFLVRIISSKKSIMSKILTYII